MNPATLRNHILTLFEPEKRGIYTCAAGYSHALYDQYTELAGHMHKQMLALLDYCGVENYLFAGSMVGYVRNKSMPYWMDDIDVMIFEEEIEKYETRALPLFSECGFNCFYQEHLKGGGYHMLSMQQGESRQLKIALTANEVVSVPWAQVDAFYSTVDENGIIRNPANWGIYHTRDVPVSMVQPGVFLDIDGMKARVFSEYADDIAKEYGDVHNTIVVANHSHTFLRVTDTPWEHFEQAFKQVLAETSSPVVDTVLPLDLARYIPQPGVYVQADPGDSLATMCHAVLKSRAESLYLATGDQTFWAMDLQRIFPDLRIHAVATTVLEAQRAAHLRAFLETVHCTTPAAFDEYDKCITRLRQVLGDSRK